MTTILAAGSAGGLLDPSSLLQSLGPWALVGLGLMIFIESGVLFPFLPGDSLILTAVLLRVDLGLSAWVIALVAGVAAVAGDQVGYWLGHRFGRRFFSEDARLLKLSRLREAEGFFAKHGGPSLVLARFVPIVRTYVPLVAGTANYTYSKFAFWNISGAILWVVLLTLAGVLLGNVPLVTDHIDLLAIIVVLVTVIPIVIAGLRSRSRAKKAALADARD